MLRQVLRPAPTAATGRPDGDVGSRAAGGDAHAPPVGGTAADGRPRGGPPRRRAGGGTDHRAARVVAAAAAGSASLLAFPAAGLWVLAPVGCALLLAAVRGASLRLAAALGGLSQLVLMVPLLSWSGLEVGPLPWLLLALSQAVWGLPLGVGLALVARLPGWPLWSAAVWVLVEAVRGRVPFGGFTWGRLSGAVVDAPWVDAARLGGAPLVSAVVALVGGLLLAAVLQVRRRPVAAVALAVAAALPAAVALLPAAGPDGRSAVVAAVQGTVPRLGLDFNAQREAVLRNHVDRTLELAADVDAGRVPAPDLVVWPENSSDVDPLADAGAGALVDSAVRAVDRPVLVGAVLGDGPDHVLNVGLLWEPGVGVVDRYVKQHPVPFAEYVPLRRLARLVSSEVDRVARDFRQGQEVGLLDVDGLPVGDVICFEVAYDGLVRETVAAGAGVLVVQTNNATFGDSDQTYQQLALSRLRAVEHGRWVVVAATSGVSAVIAPDGRVVQELGLQEPGVLVQELRLADGPSLASYTGPPVEVLLSVVALAAGVAGARRGRRARAEGTA